MKLSATITDFLTEASHNFDLTMMKVNAVMEAAHRELAINYEEAELKVMQEAGTSEDLAFLYEAAGNGLVETAIKTIEKIKDAIIKWFSDMKDKIIEMLSKKEVDETLDKIEKKCKIFPLLGRKKVVVEDIDEHEKLADKYFAKLGKLKAKFAAGQDVKAEEVEEVRDSFLKEHGKAIGIGAATTVTVAALVTLIAAKKGKLSGIMNDIKGKAVDGIDATKAATGKLAKTIGAGTSSVGNALARAYSTVAKVASESVLGTFRNWISALKENVHGFGKAARVDTKAAAALVGESADDVATQATSEPAAEPTDAPAESDKGTDTGSTEEAKTEGAESCPGCGSNPCVCEPAGDPIDDIVPPEVTDTDEKKDGFGAVMYDDPAITESVDGEDTTDFNFESVYNELFGKPSTNAGESESTCPEDSNMEGKSEHSTTPEHVDAKAKTEAILDEIMADVKAKDKNYSEEQYAKESAYDNILSAIENL
jgi:hypothetical protein